MIIQDVIDRILQNTPSLGEGEATTVDTLKCGQATWELRGIVTTTFATADVIEQAAALGANLIIAHEPSFFSHKDDTAWLAGDPVFEEKQALLARHEMAIWRFHDHMHKNTPDLIYHGVMKELGWDAHCIHGHDGKGPKVFSLPKTSLEGLAQQLKAALGMNCLRVIGQPDTPIQRVLYVGGASGARMDDDHQFTKLVQEYNIDAVTMGEMLEWNIAAYIREANLLGHGKALIALGHNCSEDLGMKYLPHWLRTILPEPLPIHFVRSPDFFSYL